MDRPLYIAGQIGDLDLADSTRTESVRGLEDLEQENRNLQDQINILRKENSLAGELKVGGTDTSFLIILLRTSYKLVHEP